MYRRTHALVVTQTAEAAQQFSVIAIQQYCTSASLLGYIPDNSGPTASQTNLRPCKALHFSNIAFLQHCWAASQPKLGRLPDESGQPEQMCFRACLHPCKTASLQTSSAHR
jgi:hypothetical protein